MIGASDERMTILKMIESNKITVEQGSQLLGALGKQAERAEPAAAHAAEPTTETAYPRQQTQPAGKVAASGCW